jgi:hypothetical protein
MRYAGPVPRLGRPASSATPRADDCTRGEPAARRPTKEASPSDLTSGGPACALSLLCSRPPHATRSPSPRRRDRPTLAIAPIAAIETPKRKQARAPAKDADAIVRAMTAGRFRLAKRNASDATPSTTPRVSSGRADWHGRRSTPDVTAMACLLPCATRCVVSTAGPSANVAEAPVWTERALAGVAVIAAPTSG